MHLRAEVEVRTLAKKFFRRRMNYTAASCGYLIREYFAEGVSPNVLLRVPVPVSPVASRVDHQ